MKFKKVELHNVWDVIEHGKRKELGISRLPLALHDEINRGARNMSQLGSACEIRGVLKRGGQARITLKAVDDNVVPATALVYRGEFLDRAVALDIGKDVEIVIEDGKHQKTMEKVSESEDHAFHARLIRVLFPPIHPVRIISIEGDLMHPTKKFLPEKRLLCYGSSITHGASAVFPSGTYSAQCARQLGMDLIDLGFGGAAQMDPPIAQHIADRKDWDVATLEMGINVRDWPPEKFQQVVRNFVGSIANAHPDKYIFCIDPFTNDRDLTGEKLEAMTTFRKIIAKVVRSQKSKKVIHVDGAKLLTDPRGLWTDLVHPNDHGMQEMGSKLANLIRKKVPFLKP
jgi:hypothetical protein